MAFRFSLESVLKIRASFERLERLRLLVLQALANRLRQEIAAARVESSEAQRRLQERMAGGTSGGELQFAAAVEQARAARIRALENGLSQVESRREKQRIVFEAARQKRQILENLRARRMEEYRRAASRREQKQADEMHLIRLATRAPEGGSE
ncbi:MAG TPA: flagellar FliJ family protein [Candidatus Aquilonibacter sp.]|nr:flagellar FliJ family protein [Candidatus Aquilonibacter sp.]